ncbi:hypothetical protein [Pseudactinotalea sp.]|uniref:hypothetical protein n=1 Tax=Pseudactinotalea sp. TaxID=1926260 RepID=UPI003B3AF2C9
MTDNDDALHDARRRTVRLVLAVNDGDQLAAVTALRDAAAEPGGVALLLQELAYAVIANAQQLDPDWADQYRDGLAQDALERS